MSSSGVPTVVTVVPSAHLKAGAFEKMEHGAERTADASASTTRAASPRIIGIALVLLGHASLVLAGVFEAAPWVPILECGAVCVIGLVHLRRVSEEVDAAPEVPASPPAAQSFAQPVVPGRVAPPLDTSERVAGT
jgi:hypothetical protein